MWFKYLLFAYFVLAFIVEIVRTGMGSGTEERQPIACALSAVMAALFAVGIWTWLID